VLTPHNHARVLSIELQRLDELHRIFHKHAVETRKLVREDQRKKSRLSGLNAPIGIGGNLAAPPLPHHRTCGSAYGGSGKIKHDAWAPRLRGRVSGRRRSAVR
jgi:hypothetical protein